MNGQCFYCEGGQTWQNKRRGKGGKQSCSLWGILPELLAPSLGLAPPPAVWVPSPTSDTPVNFYL